MEADLASRGLVITHLDPPSWRAPLLDTADKVASSSTATVDSALLTTYPGFFPTHAGQEEDILSDKAVQDGFTTKMAVQTEAFSAHQMIYEKLLDSSALTELSNLIGKVQQNVKDAQPKPLSHTFKPPARVTWNDQKRENWIADLANLDIPLSKIAKSVPYGYKGDKLLDILISRKIPVTRALWFTRVVGASEIQSQQYNTGSTQPNASEYASEWTRIVWNSLRKQLAEISVPTSSVVSRPGMSIKGKAKATLSDAEFRGRWTQKFGYTVSLASHFYAEDLLSRDAFVAALLSQMETCNQAQLVFVISVWDSISSFVTPSVSMIRRIVTIFIGRYVEVQSAMPAAGCVMECLTAVVQRTFLACPKAFLNPTLWYRHHNELHAILVDSMISKKNDSDQDEARKMVTRIKQENYEQLPIRPQLPTDEAWQGVLRFSRLLDAFEVCSDPGPLKRQLLDVHVDLADKLQLLVSWASTTQRCGDFRAAIAAKIIAELLATSSEIQFDDIFFEWLHSVSGQADISKHCLCKLLACLFEDGILRPEIFMDYATTRSSGSGADSADIHLYLLANLPLDRKYPSCSTRRNVFLQKSKEDIRQATMTLSNTRKAVLAALPFLSASSPIDAEAHVADLDSALKATDALNTLEMREAFLSRWLGPCLEELTLRHGKQLEAVLLLLQRLSAISIGINLCKRALYNITISRETFACISAFLLVYRQDVVCSEQLGPIMEALRHALKQSNSDHCGTTARYVRTMDGLLQPLKYHLPTWIDMSNPPDTLTYSCSQVLQAHNALQDPTKSKSTQEEVLTLLKTNSQHPHLLWLACVQGISDSDAFGSDVAAAVTILQSISDDANVDLPTSIAWFLDQRVKSSELLPKSVSHVLADLMCRGEIGLTSVLRFFVLPILQGTLCALDTSTSTVLSRLDVLQADLLILLGSVFQRPGDFVESGRSLSIRAQLCTTIRQDEGSLYIYALIQHLCDAESVLLMADRKATQFRQLRSAILSMCEIQAAACNNNTKWPSMLLANCHQVVAPERSFLLAESVYRIYRSRNDELDQTCVWTNMHPTLWPWRVEMATGITEASLSMLTLRAQASIGEPEEQNLQAFLQSLLFESEFGRRIRVTQSSAGQSQIISLFLDKVRAFLDGDFAIDLPEVKTCLSRFCAFLQGQDHSTATSRDGSPAALRNRDRDIFGRAVAKCVEAQTAAGSKERIDTCRRLICALVQISSEWTDFEANCSSLIEDLLEVSPSEPSSAKSFCIFMWTCVSESTRQSLSSKYGRKASGIPPSCTDILYASLNIESNSKAWFNIQMPLPVDSSAPEWLSNSGSVDVTSVGLTPVEHPTLPANLLASWHSTLSLPPLEDRRNFDSELESQRESLWQHDSRRKLVSNVPPSPASNPKGERQRAQSSLKRKDISSFGERQAKKIKV